MGGEHFLLVDGRREETFDCVKGRVDSVVNPVLYLEEIQSVIFSASAFYPTFLLMWD